MSIDHYMQIPMQGYYANTTKCRFNAAVNLKVAIECRGTDVDMIEISSSKIQ